MSPDSMSLDASNLDSMNPDAARAALSRCCGATRWVDSMLERRPFGSDLVETAREAWSDMQREDVLEAFDHHPRIGASLEGLRERFGATAELSASEQSGVEGASEAVLRRLRDANVEYEARFGHIFIVCASGKSAAQILALLEERMHNELTHELTIAAAEQMKITELRLAELSAAAPSTGDET